MSASFRRRARSPGFLSSLPPRRVQSLFGDGSQHAQPLFEDADADDEALGVEALAPPLPAPPQPLVPEDVDRLARSLEEMRQVSARMGEALAANALEIGCLIAKRILEAELKSDPELRMQLVRSAVRRLGDAQKVTVHLSPADHEAVAAAAAGGEVAGIPVARVELVGDMNLSPGDTLVETDTAIVDGRLGTRIEELRRVLSDVINASKGDRS